ncbi:BON domain-containing protein [Robbsia sp. Bb-Pol-6]|uniref:BON domain-containing protein n=1 Tax=Robbsia betulipollinis TaxID=2981849 RepID=A0ABT3ZMZ8_9BURK|nr:BON domain-containing protein [Robbsia betulipollinis]MCY0387630.1 BON domain-containing protein [Robbsia betulipollinis]
MTANHEERETYDPRLLERAVRTQEDPSQSSEVKATGTGSAEWHPAQGAGPDDWLDPAHAYATLSSASRSSGAGTHGRQQACVTTDAPNRVATLLEEVTKRVMSTDYLDTSHVRLAIQDGMVTLSGSVPEERGAEQIEQLVAGCDGVKGIDNQLRVERAAGDR